MSAIPNIKVLPDAALLNGGMDAVVSPVFAKPGTPRLAYNYEWSINGGMDRIRGFEPFDGQPSPSAAEYQYVQCSATVSGVSLGDTLTGETSSATGVVIYLSGAYIAMTAVTGIFVSEVLDKSGTPVATVVDPAPSVDGFLDNTIYKLAADYYQRAIGRVPGQGAIRGIKVLNDVVYAWRDAVGGSTAAIYKSTSSGWALIDLLNEVSFTAGSTAYAEGSSITQGSVTATVKRVVLESGTWATSDAAGRFIVTTPTGGVFSAGVAGGGGVATLSGASSAITLLPGGRVRADAYTFTASLADKRLYGCDGVNPEFEFDGTVLVPLNTGTGSIRATTARCHKQQVFFGYRGSLINSGIGLPYIYTALFGASEIGTGDEITNLISVGGSTDAAALMVLCQNAIYVLYGSSPADFDLQPLSRIQGAQYDSAQDIGGVVAVDTPGIVRYPATKNFGNFSWDIVSLQIQPLVAKQSCQCSVFVPGLFKFRVFFADGTAVSGLPTKSNDYASAQGIAVNQFAWSVIDYGITVLFAENEEIAGISRTFYADGDGWVYEADVGRSFAGLTIQYFIKLHPLSQKSPMVIKSYRQGELEVQTQSACTLYTSADFDDGEGSSVTTTTPTPGTGGLWDLTNYDSCYYDVASFQRQTVPIEGDGTSVAITIAGQADNELTHQIQSILLLYTPRKVKR